MDLFKNMTYIKSIKHSLKYLHDRNIAHRDVKPQNILISFDLIQVDKSIAKLCDLRIVACFQGKKKGYESNSQHSKYGWDSLFLSTT